MKQNNKITITVAGASGTGKTAIQRFIAAALETRFTNVDIDWGPDGPDNRDVEQQDIVLEAVKNNPILINVRPYTRQEAYPKEVADEL